MIELRMSYAYIQQWGLHHTDWEGGICNVSRVSPLITKVVYVLYDIEPT